MAFVLSPLVGLVLAAAIITGVPILQAPIESCRRPKRALAYEDTRGLVAATTPRAPLPRVPADAVVMGTLLVAVEAEDADAVLFDVLRSRRSDLAVSKLGHHFVNGHIKAPDEEVYMVVHDALR